MEWYNEVVGISSHTNGDASRLQSGLISYAGCAKS